MFNQKQAIKFLGISAAEQKILNILEQNGHCLVSGIARKTKIPRTTVHFLLKKLARRGLTSPIKIVNHKEWQMAGREEILGDIKNLLVGFEKPGETLGRVETETLGVEIFRGKNKLQECYEKMFEAGKGNRVFIIQGNGSAEVVMKKLDKEFIYDFHKEFKKRDIIMEGVIGERVLELLKDLNLEELNSHYGRLIVAYAAPDEYLNFNFDVALFKNIAILVNIVEEYAMVIRNGSLVGMLKNFLKILIGNSRKVDLNAHIKKLIEEKLGANR
ncbi:MAG: helix-turn-helix domain-containing protein [bacterium]